MPDLMQNPAPTPALNLPPNKPIDPIWYRLSGEEALAATGTARPAGLAVAEAARRLAADGPNSLPEKAGINPWLLLLGQFKSLVIWVLIVAGVVSGFMGEGVDAAAILIIVVLNGVIGFLQEYQAEKSIAALRKMTAPSAKVRRDGQVSVAPAADLVRGDIIELESGDLVPADARLLEVAGLRCLEAALTGEPEAVVKAADTLAGDALPLGDRRNMVYMGTSVAMGAATALVVGTALATEIGKIASLIESASTEESTPLQKRMDALGRTLVWICLGLVAVLFGLGLLRGREPLELFLTAVSLAVAAAPEGLPAVVTVALALGVKRMARRNALIRRLPSVETLGSATVICTDKTGTLTAGSMTVTELYVAGENFQVEGAGLAPIGAVRIGGKVPDADQLAHLHLLAEIETATLTANLYQDKATDEGGNRDEDGAEWKVAGDPTEGALLAVAGKLGLPRKAPAEGGKLFAFPFDSDRKRASAGCKAPGSGYRILVNGAPDVLLDLCTRIYSGSGILPMNAEARERILAANAALAARGLRVIGSAFRDDAPAAAGGPLRIPEVAEAERDLIFVGLAGMYDPPRMEAKAAVATCRQAGIRVVMINGDHPSTALAIGRDLGIAGDADSALTGADLDGLDDEALRAKVPGTAIYARVTAEHKLRIVRAWKSLGAVTAMTGDGVNDAPALKGADIGIAMGRSGTEVTKQASDMIVTDDNFASIVAAVEEGRGIYQNIRNTLQFLLAGNSGELLLMMVAIVAGLPSPLLPVHLLWINLVTDGLPALCLASERIDPDVMRLKPRAQTEFLSDGYFRNTLLLTGFLTAGVSLAAFLWGLKYHGRAEAQSLAFTTLVFAELLRSLGARSEDKPIWKLNPRGNLPLFAVVALSVTAQILLHQYPVLEKVLKTVPLSLPECLAFLGLGAVPLLVMELLKVGLRGRAGSNGFPPPAGWRRYLRFPIRPDSPK
jgi:P-type Ca2+ transporter type 2C